jgi:hypothetical protein
MTLANIEKEVKKDKGSKQALKKYQILTSQELVINEIIF